MATTINAFDNFYAKTLKSILDQQGFANKRTGRETKALPGVVYQSSRFPLLSLRDINIRWFCLEMVWSIAGRNDLEFFHELGLKGWDQFAQNGIVESGYGNRWRHTFQRDQLEDLIIGMTEDPSTRHGMLVTWDPRSDGLNMVRKLNVPCVVAWHFHRIGNELHCTVLQRSADMIVGYPHDVAGAYLLLALLAPCLEISQGSLTYMVSNAHVYEDHYEQAKIMMIRGQGRHISSDDFDIVFHGVMRDILNNSTDNKMLVDIAMALVEAIECWYDPMPKIQGMKVIA